MQSNPISLKNISLNFHDTASDALGLAYPRLEKGFIDTVTLNEIAYFKGCAHAPLGFSILQLKHRTTLNCFLISLFGLAYYRKSLRT